MRNRYLMVLVINGLNKNNTFYFIFKRKKYATRDTFYMVNDSLTDFELINRILISKNVAWKDGPSGFLVLTSKLDFFFAFLLQILKNFIRLTLKILSECFFIELQGNFRCF